MSRIEYSGASAGQFPEIPKFDLARRRIEAAGASPALAVALADMIPQARRDQVCELMAMTAARVASYAGVRS